MENRFCFFYVYWLVLEKFWNDKIHCLQYYYVAFKDWRYYGTPSSIHQQSCLLWQTYLRFLHNLEVDKSMVPLYFNDFHFYHYSFMRHFLHFLTLTCLMKFSLEILWEILEIISCHSILSTELCLHSMSWLYKCIENQM